MKHIYKVYTDITHTCNNFFFCIFSQNGISSFLIFFDFFKNKDKRYRITNKGAMYNGGGYIQRLGNSPVVYRHSSLT